MPITSEVREQLVSVLLKSARPAWDYRDFIDEMKTVDYCNKNLNIAYDEIFSIANEASQRHEQGKAEVPKENKSEEQPEPNPDIPELLPFSKLPGYLLDPWGVPHRQVGKGRKPGKVLPDNRFFTKKGRPGKPQHMWRYRLTIDGIRKDFYPRYLAMARLLAEKEWMKSLDGQTEKALQTAH